ncbi:MAG: efflux RND transporter periplasmic adaptor subunit [Deltaproteobacteria bacterium]|nr:efflux RND transporter periplasmic adaptor subunit [Deltaproteobacteria bacterium]
MDQLSSDLASLRISRDEPTGPSRTRGVAFVLVGVAAVAAVGYFAVTAIGARVFKQTVEATTIALISPSQAAIQVTSTGYVVPQVTSKVGVKVAGRIESVLVKEGDVVKKGDVIATLANAEQRSAINAASSRVLVARARIETAKANLAEVTRQLERSRNLLAGNAVPRAQVEDLTARAEALSQAEKAARAEAVASEAEAQTLRVALDDRVILAPIDGTVVAKPVAAGESVNLSSSVAELADFSSIVVETDVPEARLGLVSVGAPCEIVLDAYPTRRYRGVASEIGRRVNRAKATVVVKVRFEDSTDGVLPEMAARVSFLREKLSDAALQEKPKKVVAKEAIVERDGRSVLFVIENGQIKETSVQLGDTVGSSVELKEGPAAGVRVVRNPTAELRSGTKVKTSED